MRTKKLLLLAAMLLSGVCATFAQSENEHPLDFILGFYEAEGEDYYDNWAVENWPATIKKDDSDPSKVWIYDFTPAGFPDAIYGIVDEEKTEIRIPVNQTIGSNSSYDVVLEAYTNNGDEDITDFIVGTISEDGTITITPTTWIAAAAYNKGTTTLAGYYAIDRAVVFKKTDMTGSGIFLNAATFPDANFRAALAEKLYINEGDELAMGHLQTKKLSVNGKSIINLTGIEHFTALEELYCYNNQLTSLDVSKNTALRYLSCYNNQLTSLNISENTALTKLSCYGNQLTDLDVSKNTALEYLSCNFNRLTTLNVSNNTRLTELYCRGNQLTSLDVSKNTALIQFWCHTNQIKGEAMDALVNSLPTVENVVFYVIDTQDDNEGNVCTKSQVAVAKGKGWIVYDYNGGNPQIYDGNSNPIRKTTVDGIEWTYTIVSVADKTCIVGGEEVRTSDYGDYTWTEPVPAINVNTTGAITIPSVLGGYSVIGIAPRAFSDCEISSVVVPEGVVKIGRYAFSYCKNLTSVRLPESLVRIESYAFAETKLSSISLSKNVKFLGDEEKMYPRSNDLYDGVFDDCELLEEVNVDEANTAYASVDGMLLTKDKKILLFCPQLNTAEKIPEGVEEIYRDAFYLCKKATISLPNSLKSIGESAFYGSSIESIVIPGGVSRIEECIFESCKKLSSITLPKGLTYIGEEAFKYCPITSINLGESLVFIGDDAFWGTKLTSVTLPKSLLVIEGDAFADCPLQTVISKIEDPFFIEDGAFGGEKSDYNSFETATLYVPYGTKAKYEATRYWNKFVNIVEMDLVPVDEDNNVDFGNGMDESDNLDGAVIRDIYYNIGDGKGEYNADEGCVVIKKTTDDGTVDGLSGKDIFGEDFKGQFTGIVFKVPAGKGTIKVNAETTGNMLLKVKIGNNEPVGMELNGKLKATFPYNVSETTYVYIYAGANNEAKGFGTTNATDDAALKIYGIEFERGETTGVGTSLNDNGQRTNDSWYTIDGKKLNGEPKKKGIYIYNGKKVVK